MVECGVQEAGSLIQVLGFLPSLCLAQPILPSGLWKEVKWEQRFYPPWMLPEHSWFLTKAWISLKKKIWSFGGCIRDLPEAVISKVCLLSHFLLPLLSLDKPPFSKTVGHPEPQVSEWWHIHYPFRQSSISPPKPNGWKNMKTPQEKNIHGYKEVLFITSLNLCLFTQIYVFISSSMLCVFIPVLCVCARACARML